MRGLGEKQAQISEKTKRRILLEIKLHSHYRYPRYATVNDIHRSSGIAQDIIRKHINELLDEAIILEENVGYNARGFMTVEHFHEIKHDKELLRNYIVNTQSEIYQRKYPEIQEPFRKTVKSTRDYGSLTEKQEKLKLKKRS
jgi:hypothetical protein